MNIDTLLRIPLFASLPADELAHVAGALQEGRYDGGAILFKEGDAGNRLYIIDEGQLEVVKAIGTPDERVVAVRSQGDYVGEMSLIQDYGRRSASVRARSALRTLEMTRADFDALLHRHPEIAYQMARVLSAHLTEAHTAALNEMREKNQALSNAYESLKAAQTQIIQKEKLEHELQMARNVQAGLMPRSTPALEGWEFAARWIPAREVSGDFYDFIPMVERDGVSVVVADVSDKGMPAALLTSLSRSVMRATIAPSVNLADAVQRANRLLCADMTDYMFVTLFACTLDPATGQVEYVNAGHNPPLQFQQDNQRWQELKLSGMVLGVFEEAQFVQHELCLNPHDVIVIYTDGVTDALNPAGEMFGRERLMTVLRAAENTGAAGIAHALEQALAEFTAGLAPFDDMTYVVIKRS